jgi:hypothetical protein
MSTMTSTRHHDDDVDDSSGDFRQGQLGQSESELANVDDNQTKNRKLPSSVQFFAGQRDVVVEIFSFLDPPSLTRMCTALSFVTPFLTHVQVIRSVSNALKTEVYDLNNECLRRNRHRYRHIQYHRIVVEKLMPNIQKHACTRQTPIQLLQSATGRYCERCQLDLICVTGW